MNQEKMTEIYIWCWDKMSGLTPGHTAVEIEDHIYELVEEGFKKRDKSQVSKAWANAYLTSIIERILPRAIQQISPQIEDRFKDTLRRGDRVFKVPIEELTGPIEKPVPAVFVYPIKISSTVKGDLLGLCTSFLTHKRDMGDWHISENNCVHAVAKLLNECSILHLEAHSNRPHRFRQEELEKRVQQGSREGERGKVEKPVIRVLKLEKDNYVWGEI